MPPRTRKTASKKTAAKKTAAKAAAPAFPLAGDGYLSTSPLPRRSTSRGPAVAAVRAALGLPTEPAIYDERVRKAVMAFQADRQLEVTGVVATGDWEALFSAAPAGPVDRTDEPDDPTGELDAPQGPE